MDIDESNSSEINQSNILKKDYDLGKNKADLQNPNEFSNDKFWKKIQDEIDETEKTDKFWKNIQQEVVKTEKDKNIDRFIKKMKKLYITKKAKISSLSDFLVHEKDSSVVKKVLSEIDDIYLAGVLADNTIDSIEYRKIISNLPIEKVGKFSHLIRGFDSPLTDLSEFQYGYGKMNTDTLLSIAYDDRIYKNFEQYASEKYEVGFFTDANNKKISQHQIATGMKNLLDLYAENGYKFSDPEIEKRIRKIVSEYYEPIPQSVIDSINRIYNHDTKILTDEVGTFVDPEKIKKAAEIVHFLPHDEYLVQDPSGRSNGFFLSKMIESDGEICVDMSYDDSSVPIHEMLHFLSFNRKNRKIGHGVKYNWKYTGINESITEFITQLTLGKEYVPGRCAYEPAIVRLKVMLDLNIDGFDIDTIKKAYFNNDISLIKKPLEKATNNSEFVDFLLDYCFNEGTLKGKLDSLDIALGDFITLIKQNGGN